MKAVANYAGVPYTLPSGVEQTTYTVQRGDTLYSIARKYNLTVDELKTLNNLTSNTLSIGQVLQVAPPVEVIIPEETVTTYTVQRGDTLYSIARKYNLTVDELKTLNNLTSNTLSIGQVLQVAPPVEVIIPEETVTTYTVQRGD
ncbi:MAG: LysM peptidoglycan-binding domain-containing protein [Clostridia bacterium]|nr:LysM peptidoglycan-binding domain-containing protein [Clostridia bacterium]